MNDEQLRAVKATQYAQENVAKEKMFNAAKLKHPHGCSTYFLNCQLTLIPMTFLQCTCTFYMCFYFLWIVLCFAGGYIERY